MLLTWGGTIRILRRRIVLALIFGLSFTYCVISLLARDKVSAPVLYADDDVDDNMTIDNDDLPLDDEMDEEIQDKNLPWPISSQDDLNEETASLQVVSNSNAPESISQNCRNSIQGKSLIVDDKGYVCARQDVLPMGCCKRDQDITSQNNDKTIIKKERYSCETCNAQGCCAIYEYCVSCCLHPARRKPKKDVEGGNARRGIPKRKVEDVVNLRFRSLDKFQVCLAVCRTSSASVRHENTYKDPHSKHCYRNSMRNIIPQRTGHDSISFDNNNGDNVVIASSSTVSLMIPNKHLFSPVYKTLYKNIKILLLIFYRSVIIRNAFHRWNYRRKIVYYSDERIPRTRLDFIIQTSWYSTFVPGYLFSTNANTSSRIGS